MLTSQPEREPDSPKVPEDIAPSPAIGSYPIPPPETPCEIPIVTVPLGIPESSPETMDEWAVDTTSLLPFSPYPYDTWYPADEDTLSPSDPDSLAEISSETAPASYLTSIPELDEPSVDTTTASASYLTSEFVDDDITGPLPVIGTMDMIGMPELSLTEEYLEGIEDGFETKEEVFGVSHRGKHDTEKHKLAKHDVEFVETFHAYSPHLHRFILHKTKNYDDAHDIVQETFIAVSENWSELRTYSSKRLKSWLYYVATNKANDFWRRIKRRLQLVSQQSEQWELDNSYEYPSFIEGNWQQARYVHMAFKELSPREGECLLLHKEDFSHTEIADLLQLKEKSVSGTISRAKKKFREVYLRLQQNDEGKA